MDVVVKGRHCSVTDRFRTQVEDKIVRLERFAAKIIRVEVEVSKERNPRLADRSERVELTVLSKGPAVRAEAAADDRYAALDLALDKLLSRLRKAADRKRIHHGSRTPVSVAKATAGLSNGRGSSNGTVTDAGPSDLTAREEPTHTSVAGIDVVGDGPLVVREKTHQAMPITLDQALYEMELVGHDFYLYIDADSKQASVVYRRRGYDYGVIRLEGPTL
ncbi:ribosome hibernation promotion factor [Flindersiella endophytica]